MRLRPAPRSTRISTESTSRASCGVSTRRASLTGAQPVTTSETGASTSCTSRGSGAAPPASFVGEPPPCQRVRIDSESFPTGIASPSSRHSDAQASTASNRSASSAGSPHAAIQFADSFTCSSDPIGAAARFVTVSATAMRDAARGSMTASGVRSPIASASPR